MPRLGAIFTVRPLVCSSALTTAAGAGAFTGTTAIVPALTERPNRSPSSVIRIIGKTSDQNSVIRRRNVMRSCATVVARNRPKLTRGTPARSAA